MGLMAGLFPLIFLHMTVWLNLEPLLLLDVELPQSDRCHASDTDAILHYHIPSVVEQH